MTDFAGAERCRRWSVQQKRAIVDATLAPGAMVLDIARAADVGANRIYRWRRELGVRRIAPDGFAAVRIEPDGQALDRLPGAVMTIEIGGAVIRVSGTARPGWSRRFCRCCDDRDAARCADLDYNRPHRRARRDEGAGAVRAGALQARCARWRYLCLQGQVGIAVQDLVA